MVKERVNKSAMAIDFLGWIILAVIVLVVFVAAFYFAGLKGVGVLDYIKDLLKWG